MNLIRLSKSCVGQEEKSALERVIDAGYLGMGEEVRLFESEIQAFLGTKSRVICVSTGTSALHLALQAMGIGVEDEVLVPSLTYVASFQAVSATGAKPIACDVTWDKGFIDLDDASKRVTSKTKAIMPVHYGSNSDGMEEVYRFAKKFNLRVIEDAAHGFGCVRDGINVGAIGDVICFSFDGIKNITSGEGGAVVTGDLSLAEKIEDLRLLGVEKDTEKRYKGERSWNFDVKSQGWRNHMSNLMASIGREQLKKINSFGDHRRQCAEKYAYELNKFGGIKLFNFNYHKNIPHIFPVKVLNGRRDELMQFLKERNIESGIHYMPNHFLSIFSTLYKLPVVEKLSEELLSLPLHANLSNEEQARVIEGIDEFYKKHA